MDCRYWIPDAEHESKLKGPNIDMDRKSNRKDASILAGAVDYGWWAVAMVGPLTKPYFAACSLVCSLASYSEWLAGCKVLPTARLCMICFT